MPKDVLSHGAARTAAAMRGIILTRATHVRLSSGSFLAKVQRV